MTSPVRESAQKAKTRSLTGSSVVLESKTSCYPCRDSVDVLEGACKFNANRIIARITACSPRVSSKHTSNDLPTDQRNHG